MCRQSVREWFGLAIARAAWHRPDLKVVVPGGPLRASATVTLVRWQQRGDPRPASIIRPISLDGPRMCVAGKSAAACTTTAGINGHPAIANCGKLIVATTASETEKLQFDQGPMPEGQRPCSTMQDPVRRRRREKWRPALNCDAAGLLCRPSNRHCRQPRPSCWRLRGGRPKSAGASFPPSTRRLLRAKSRWRTGFELDMSAGDAPMRTLQCRLLVNAAEGLGAEARVGGRAAIEWHADRG